MEAGESDDGPDGEKTHDRLQNGEPQSRNKQLGQVHRKVNSLWESLFQQKHVCRSMINLKSPIFCHARVLSRKTDI